MKKTRKVDEVYEVCDLCGVELDYQADATYPNKGVCSVECSVFNEFPTKEDYLKSLKNAK